MTSDERRDQLLDAAAEIVVEQGLDALTMEGLAAQSGVSKALPYAHFENSEDVLAALFDREMADLDRRVGERVDRAETFEDQIRGTLDAMFGVVAGRGVLVGALLNGGGGGAALAERQQARAVSNREWMGGLIAAEFGIPRARANLAAGMCLAAGAEAINLWAHRQASRKELAATLIAVVMDGLRGLAEPARRTAGLRRL